VKTKFDVMKCPVTKLALLEECSPIRWVEHEERMSLPQNCSFLSLIGFDIA